MPWDFRNGAKVHHTKNVPAELRGTSYGLYNLVSGMCFFVSNMTFGYIWDIYGVNLAVLFSLCFSFSSIAGMSVFVKSYSNNKPIKGPFIFKFGNNNMLQSGRK